MIKDDEVERLTTELESPFWVADGKQAVDPGLLRAARARILKLEAELWEALEGPEAKK